MNTCLHGFPLSAYCAECGEAGHPKEEPPPASANKGGQVCHGYDGPFADPSLSERAAGDLSRIMEFSEQIMEKIMAPSPTRKQPK